jgi:hypothetical protein
LSPSPPTTDSRRSPHSGQRITWVSAVTILRVMAAASSRE